jgi:single-strand DNA-binding protein
MNQTAVVMMAGHVVSDPKLSDTKSGQPFTKVRIGVTTRKQDRLTGEWKDVASSYFTVSCWRRMATNAAASLRKGDPVIVWGKLKSRVWVDGNGEKHRIIDIEADTICHDASMGWTHFMRGRALGPTADEQAQRDLAARQDLDIADVGSPDDFADRGGTDGALLPVSGFRAAEPAVEPGDDEVPVAADEDPVAALATEAVPF